MRNRVKSYKKKSPITLLCDGFHSSALQLSFARKKIRGVFRNCCHCYPHLTSPIAVIYKIRKCLHLLRYYVKEEGTKYIFQYFKRAKGMMR